jgi:hypothetical protein
MNKLIQPDTARPQDERKEQARSNREDIVGRTNKNKTNSVAFSPQANYTD